MRLILILALMLLACLHPAPAQASFNEVSGIVTRVVSGDTFDVRIDVADPEVDASDLEVEAIDSKVVQTIVEARLADVISPDISMPKGLLARDFAAAILLNKTIWLDIDDLTKDEEGRYGGNVLICVVYFAAQDGVPIASPCFNRMLVDYGYAELEDEDTNEFDPADWWAPPTDISKNMPSSTSSFVSTGASSDVIGWRFVGSKSSNKYHHPNCKWAINIDPNNQVWFSSPEEAKAAGYVPCSSCRPP